MTEEAGVRYPLGTKFVCAVLEVALVLCLMAAPLVAEAQERKIWHIGAFHVGLDHVPVSLEPLRQSLKALGYEEGRNLRLDWRNLPDEDAARETAKEFVRNRVDLIVAFENQTVRAAKAATSAIPIVFLHAPDPVADGFVSSLAHPGGNLTGFAGTADMPDKQLELFKEIAPKLRRVLVLVSPQDPATERRLAAVQRTADIMKVRLVEREASNQADLERVFGSLKQGDVDCVVVASVSLRANFSSLLVRLASERRLPFASHRKEWVAQGALFSYGPSMREIGAAAAPYIDRIFKGAKASDLPVQQPTKFELVINTKTAKELGLTIPPAILLRADQLME